MSRASEDFQFYVRNAQRFTFCPFEPVSVPYDPSGISAEEAFKLFDSQGAKALKPCREPEVFKSAIRCKASINWQIKEWADACYDTITSLSDMLSEFDAPPPWVGEAIKGSVVRKHGYLTTWFTTDSHLTE